MKIHTNPPNSADKQIESTLSLLAHAQPPAELEQRIHARLQHEPVHKNFADGIRNFFFTQRILFASAAAAVAGCAIVIGSVQHSRQRPFAAPGIHIAAPSSGLGAASGARIAPQPVAVPDDAHSRSERKTTSGRATVSRNARKPKGVAVPDSTKPEKP
jgi:hypothetical protein